MGPRSKRKLVVVANRGPYRLQGSGSNKRWERSSGGLVTALDPVLRGRGGMWVSAREGEGKPVAGSPPEDAYQLPVVDLSRSDQRGFYLGVSNAVLWPMLHSFPPTIRIAEAPWRTYMSANRAFAETTLASSRPSDLVWVQDYHLMLVPGMIRAKRPKARIGWFCHVPWPSIELFGILPWRREILEGLLGGDVLGFHTEQYAHNFCRCVERLTDHPVDIGARTIRVGGREVRAVAAPIGIPVDELQTMAAEPEVMNKLNHLKKAAGGRRIILGVDRLDYTKGIPERILAYEQFLKSYRQARHRYMFVQVMVPSRQDVRAYAQLKNEVDRLIGDINGRYSSTGREAISYMFRNLDQLTLYAHYRAADVALVTPLRDGMNLVAQEYVASRLDEGGALVLSEFAGAASYLHGAILVNPYDIHAIAEKLQYALDMSEGELHKRMKNMRQEVLKLDVHRWADTYLALLEEVDG
ncbi:MAG: alpha,alpha-trehalose-phosphate synthase (UDP-forming) [Myxococcota bacterium]